MPDPAVAGSAEAGKVIGDFPTIHRIRPYAGDHRGCQGYNACPVKIRDTISPENELIVEAFNGANLTGNGPTQPFPHGRSRNHVRYQARARCIGPDRGIGLNRLRNHFARG